MYANIMRRWVCLFATTCAVSAYAGQDLSNLLARAAAATGTAYTAIRAEAIAAGTNALPYLREVAADSNATWQTRLVANAWTERIARSNEVAAFVAKEWTQDPEFDRDWLMALSGLSERSTGFFVRRYEQAGLWFHYLETYWKKTGEVPSLEGKREWSGGIAVDVLPNSPARPFLIEVLEEDLSADPAYNGKPREVPMNMTSRGDRAYECLKQMGLPRSVPLLIRRSAKGYGGRDTPFDPDLSPLLRPEHLPLLYPYRSNDWMRFTIERLERAQPAERP